ncbi:hypothetical protein FT641_19035 [Bacillus paranthracis]|uniref:dUTP diphosphatase n=1 Tax=Bacillus paranthracis TaxID=2026186 RepID=UPI00187A89A1|nr:dUTP diphosphatase [Bacillus paranthracis]MBE7114339.1 hypothetical protein [Bacillus paranthracis]MBE7154788.1 hypothetical protein [Bacillus paranthracis]
MDIVKFFEFQTGIDGEIAKEKGENNIDFLWDKIIYLQTEIGKLSQVSKRFDLTDEDVMDNIFNAYMGVLRGVLSLGVVMRSQNRIFTYKFSNLDTFTPLKVYLTKSFHHVMFKLSMMYAGTSNNQLPIGRDYKEVLGTILAIGNYYGYTEEKLYESLVKQ